LGDRIQWTVIASRAASTLTSYLKSLKRWKLFTQQHQSISYFPAQPTYVALNLQHILETNGSYHSVDAAFYALKCAHTIAGVPPPTDYSIVNFVREGARRILGTSQTNRKQPLTIEQLNLMISRANLNNTLELRNVWMYSLAYVGLLRFDDLIRIKRCDLSFSSDHLTIVIAKSKNDQLRKGNEVLISETASPTSSIKLLQLYLSRVQIPCDCDKYIFRHIVKSRSHHSLVKDNMHISYTTFRNSLKI
jgi:integrase